MTKIIVIGAGVSGIAAATKLLENGFRNLLVLEGESRIGGRVHTIPFASNVVDLGAQWCHGEKDNVVFQLANPHGFFSSATTKYDNFACIKSNGDVVDEKISSRLCEMAIGILEGNKDELKTYLGSLGSFIVEKYGKLLETEEYKDIDKNTAYQFLDFFHRYENSIEASDTWYDTSARGYLHYWDCDGDRLLNWKDRGYKTILDLLMKKIPNPTNAFDIEDKILLNKTVTKIDYGRNDGFVNVQCADGTSYLANHVISTVSLGVLKENYLSMFEPALPRYKVNAIQGLGIGTVDKIYLEFEKPFWSDNWQGFSLLWEQSDMEEVKKRSAWLQDVFGFYIVDFQPNVLCGWISGPRARMMEMASEDEIRRDVMFLLRKFLKTDVPEPKRVLTSSWYSNPHFRGSYSFRSVTTDLLQTSAADLARPLTNSQGVPILQFAGEATHDHYYSTVHGALETGWREAGRIIDFYKSNVTFANPEVMKNLPKIVREVDVLILGGGLAGLGAAYHLKCKSNLSFVILEAAIIEGGRILSANMSNPKVISESTYADIINAGAQWLHGKENKLYELAKSYNLLSNELSEEGLGAYLRNDGMRFNDYLVKKVDFIVGQILEDCEEFAQSNSDDFPTSMGAFLLQEFEKRLNEFETPEDQRLAKQLLDWHIRFQIIDNSCLTIDDVSAKSWGTYSFNGESCQAHINFKTCFSDILAILMMEIGPYHMLCENKVEKIAWGIHTDGQKIQQSTPPKVIVKCENGNIFIAKHVICTFSLGVLKETANEMFAPKIPEKHLQAINSMGFGTIDKIYLQFSEPFWGNEKGIQLIYEDPNYENADWTRMISGFDVLEPGPKNTLLGWIGGTGAIEMEKLRDEEIIDKVTQLLEKFMKQQIPKPIKYHVTRWHSNPNVRGAYSYVSKECDATQISPKTLAMPIFYKDLNNKRPSSDTNCDNCPQILFAGEACHEQYYSTAHGAFLSGAEQAEKIIEFRNLFAEKENCGKI